MSLKLARISCVRTSKAFCSVALAITFASMVSAASLDCDCGKKFTSTRIVGGRAAASGSYPWQVAFITASSGQQFCGGTLINSRWVLTAAHCLYQSQSPSTYLIVLGETDLTSVGPSSKHRVTQQIIHPGYTSSPSFQNDLALVELDEAVEFTDTVWPACLPGTGGPRVYGTLQISGWGLTSPRGTQPTKLREATVSQRSQAYCGRMYGSKYTSKQMCANAAGRDVCNGDSGGPLMYTASGKTFVVGIVSYGLVCGYLPYPAVFTRTDAYADYIIKATASGQYCRR